MLLFAVAAAADSSTLSAAAAAAAATAAVSLIFSKMPLDGYRVREPETILTPIKK